ncbi:MULTISPECIES: hypothetical protein [Paenibacillus]|uniref:Uncharacterized protein n=1 Tax=Paenibacillus odorifer TaxID=189426 RepID=A0ABX3HVB0_9BACL|nr:hypothetical protein [Paenibacillus odorifer]OMD55301.1 hypothetical protein BSK51_04405 [Paenibacillus odorifer]
MKEASIKYIHEKREQFSNKVLLYALGITSVLIGLSVTLINFKAIMIAYFIGLLLISYLTYRTMDKIYAEKVSLKRKTVIENCFPIVSNVTIQQKELILLDIDYMFERLEGMREIARKDKEPLVSMNDIALIGNKLENNLKLTTIEVDGLNRMYSKGNHNPNNPK